MIYNNNSQPVGPYYFFLYEVVKDKTKLEGKIQADLKSRSFYKFRLSTPF